MTSQISSYMSETTKIKGRVFRLADASSIEDTGYIEGETSATLTISGSLVESASRNAGRSTTKRQNMLTWRIEGEANITSKQAYNLLVCMRGSNIATAISFMSTLETGKNIILNGRCIYTRLSIRATGNNIVKASFSAIGTGKPAIDIS